MTTRLPDLLLLSRASRGVAHVFVLLVALGALAPGVPTTFAADDVDDASDSRDTSSAAFDLLEFVVEGNSVLTPLEIERAVYRHLGPGRTARDAEAAADALEQAYRNQGYLTVTVDVPEQKVDDGRVVLKVTESRVARIPVSGNRYWSRGWIRAAVPSLQVGEVPRFPDLQRELAAFNASPERSATPVLRPGRAPGEVEVELKVAEKPPARGSIEINNRNAAGTTAARVVASFAYDNLWGRGHKAGLTTILSPQDFSEVQVLVGNYLWKVPDSRHVVAVYAVRSRSDLAALGGLSILGDADIVGARYVIPLDAYAGITHNLFLGADYKSFKEDIRSGGATGGVVTPITYTPFTAQYEATRPDARGTTKAALTTVFGVRGQLFGNDEGAFDDRRFGASANFMVLKADLRREQTLSGRWSLAGRLGLQGASGRLVNTEQFLAGGVDTVRGYFEAEALGDDATLASLELRSPDLAPGDGREVVAFGFTDAADIRTKLPRPGVPGSVNLWSVGAGVRFKQTERIDAALEVGLPMEDGPVRSRRGEPRLHARLAWKF
jgi:hemolysin activation/secretion protein